MSPEQARGEVDNLGPAADIYSLGATLYYVLVGRAPFTDQDAPEILLNVERGEFPRPRHINPAIDRALDAICSKAMSLKPEDRYASCLALADDLEHWLADQPVSAYPEPVSTRAMRWVRKRKEWVAAAGLLVLLSLIGLAAHDWSLGREQAQTKQALAREEQERKRTSQDRARR